MEKMEKRRYVFKYDHIPDEIWFEILSRMPIKSLLVSRAVCKSWNTMAVSLMNKIRRLPSCGLVLFDIDSYICLKTKKMTSFLTADSPDKCTVMSGYDKGWLGDLSFDFSALFNQTCFYCVSRGLLLISLEDGTHLVHNPATSERFIVPKSPMAEKYGSENSVGAIIRLLGSPVLYGAFVVVRVFCKRNGNYVEFFTSWTGNWFRYMEDLGDPDLAHSDWTFDNYVPLIINRRLMVFFLTEYDRGVVIKFATRYDPMVVHGFPLPEFLYGGSECARLGEWGGCLYLCYSITDEFWFWKCKDYGGSTIADDVWLPLLRLTDTQQFWKVPVRPQNLVKLLNDSRFLITMGFDVDRPVVFLYVYPIIYAYNLANDTLEKVAEDDKEDSYIQTVYPFKPFFGSLKIPKPES